MSRYFCFKLYLCTNHIFIFYEKNNFYFYTFAGSTLLCRL